MFLLVELVEILFKLLKSKRSTIPFTEVVTCTQLSVEFGCSFSQLSSDLVRYLPELEILLEKREESREKLELLKLAYHCCYNIAVDHRLEVCRFTEKISKHIHSVFKVDLNEDNKVKLFRLMDLALVVHYPMLESGQEKLKFVENSALWNSQLRNYAYIVDLELKPVSKTKLRGIAKQDLNQIFVQFAARLCYLIYWDDLIWQETDGDEQNHSKRQRRFFKLQALIEFTQPVQGADFNWKWLVVIAEVICNYPPSLQADDYQLLLQTIAQFQSSMEGEVQIYAFTKICSVMLEKEPEFIAASNPIIVKVCKELWHKIATGAVRACTSNAKNSIESHVLLQVLIRHNKQPSSSFIEDAIKIFLANSTIKCDTTLQTLVVIMSYFNLDTIPNGKDLLEKLLEYTFEKASLSNLRKVIKTSGKDKPTSHMLAKIGTICCLSQTDFVRFSTKTRLDFQEIFHSNWDLKVQEAYISDMNEICHHIMLKHNEKLLIEDDDFIKIKTNSSMSQSEEKIPTEIKCIIDQQLFEKLQKVTEFTTKIIDESKDIEAIKDYLLLVLENNELMMTLADSFLKFEAFNEEKFKSSFITKKIDFHLQEIERLFKLIVDKKTNLEMYVTSDLLSFVVTLFSKKYHKVLCQKIRSVDMTNCLTWISHQVERKFTSAEDDETEPMALGLDEFLNAKLDEKMKFVAVAALCEYNNFSGVNSELFLDLLADVEFDVDENMDLHCILHIIKVFGSQSQPDSRTVKWLWSYIAQICKYYNGNQYLSSRLIESFEDILLFSKDDPSMANNVISIFSSFAQLCSKPQYKASVTVKFIEQMKIFHQV